jgi:predicted AAA+ superfamily ATPase
MYIRRDLEKKLEKYKDVREIIAIVGTRQCGKTTLIEHFFSKLKNKEMISFEDQKTLNLFSTNIDLFIEIHVKGIDYLFIDEFQYAKNGGKQLKYIYDNYDVKIFITGSSAPDLAVHGLKFLVGRVFILNLYPFSFSEFLRYKNEKLHEIYLEKKSSKEFLDMINRYYQEFAIYGGYPRVITSKTIEEKKDVLKNIYNTYFLREVKEILQLSDNFKLAKLIKILALQTGSLTNYSELCSTVEYKNIELLKSLNVLVQTFICIEAKPFFTNKKKEIIKSPEFFFLDNGFRNIVLNNFQALGDRVDTGSLNENFVASELIKGENELKYWRTKFKAEVDFILEKNGETIPIEVKSQLNDKKITRSFRNFLDMYEPKKGFIFSYNLIDSMNIKKTKVDFRGIVEIGKFA